MNVAFWKNNFLQTGLESKLHIPTPKFESILFGNKTESV